MSQILTALQPAGLLWGLQAQARRALLERVLLPQARAQRALLERVLLPQVQTVRRVLREPVSPQQESFRLAYRRSFWISARQVLGVVKTSKILLLRRSIRLIRVLQATVQTALSKKTPLRLRELPQEVREN